MALKQSPFIIKALTFPTIPRPATTKPSSPLLRPKPIKPITVKMSSAGWSCKKCTFNNSPTSKSACKICLTPVSPPHVAISPSSDEESQQWACEACTLLNSFKNSDCVMCGTRAPRPFSDDTSIESELDPLVGSVFLPLRSCKRKATDFDGGGQKSSADLVSGNVLNSSKRLVLSKDFVSSSEHDRLELGGVRALDKAASVTVLKGDVDSPKLASSLKILSYNVWFREDLELRRRMKAIGDLIQLHSPDIICLQEVTPEIFEIFQRSTWWKTYRCNLSSETPSSSAYFCMQLSKLPVKSFSIRPFWNSIMGRELCIAELQIGGNKPLVVATSHLESPCPGPPKWDQMFSKERVVQANEAVNFLKENRNVIFAGDMNWDDKLDGQFPLPSGWIDAWAELKAGDNGWTYDTKSNQMLTGNRTLQKRLDRVLCCLRDFSVSSIEMVGKEAIPGLSYIKEKKVRQEVKKLELPVLPSDHYGLLLTLSAK